jgi:hypothetical protein
MHQLHWYDHFDFIFFVFWRLQHAVQSDCFDFCPVSNLPPAIQEVTTPFTLELSVSGMIPGSEYWNFTELLSEHKFILSFGTHKPVVANSIEDHDNVLTKHSNGNLTADPVRRLAFSIKNGNGLQTPPCEVKRNGLNDAYSTFNLTSTAPNGLKWVEIGSDKPKVGTEIVNEPLALALQYKTQFTRAEFDKFGVSQLNQDSYIQGKAGDRRYFRPAEAEPKQPNQKLHGMWQGTCNPRVPARSWNCNVNLNVKEDSGAFEMMISGCGGFGITNFAQGVLVEQSKEGFPWELGWIAPDIQRLSSKRYKNVLVHYGSGVPAGTTAGWISFASLFYDEDCDTYGCTDIRPNSIILNIFRPGESDDIFPSEVVVYASQQTKYPCQVLTLTRVMDADLEVRSPKTSAFLNALKLRFRYLDLYREFNSSLHEIKNRIRSKIGGEACDRAMIPFFDAEASILTSPPTISSDACLSPCFAEMNRSFSEFAATGVELWRQFLDVHSSSTSGLADVDAEDFQVNKEEYNNLKRFFQARVLHVAEFLARSALACTGNYKSITCIEYSSNFVKNICRNRFDSPRHAADMSSLSLNPKTAGTCEEMCANDIEDIIVNGHCCSATFEAVQRHWADFVVPGRKTLEIDFSVYRCLYSALTPSAGNNNSRAGHCANSTPEIVTAKHPAQGTPEVGCGASLAGGQSLKCAFDGCVKYSVPPLCCNRLQVFADLFLWHVDLKGHDRSALEQISCPCCCAVQEQRCARIRGRMLLHL